MTIPLQSYLAFNAPDESIAVMKDFNYNVLNVKSKSDLSECISQFIRREGEKGLNALAKIHPDRDLILGSTDQVKMGVDGISETIPAQVVKQTALEPQTINHKPESSYIPVLIGGLIASALFLSAAIIAKK